MNEKITKLPDEFLSQFNIRISKLEGLIKEMDKYLDSLDGSVNQIGTGSIFHMQMKRIIND